MPILQINFKLNVPSDQYAAKCRGVEQVIANAAGLHWKIWILNEEQKEAGGIYFFDTEQALSDYVSGHIVGHLRTDPAVAELSIKRFDVIEELTRVTRGPVFQTAATS